MWLEEEEAVQREAQRKCDALLPCCSSLHSNEVYLSAAGRTCAPLWSPLLHSPPSLSVFLFLPRLILSLLVKAKGQREGEGEGARGCSMDGHSLTLRVV